MHSAASLYPLALDWKTPAPNGYSEFRHPTKYQCKAVTENTASVRQTEPKR